MKICCSHCGVQGHADDEYAGKELQCPKCNGRFLAQAQSEAQNVTEDDLLISTDLPDDKIHSVADGIADQSETDEKNSALPEQVVAEFPINSEVIEFSFGALCRDAWRRTKGIKGTIWAAISMMSLVMLILRVACVTILPEEGFLTVGVEVALSVVSSFFFTSLGYMGIVVARNQPLHWKMIFTSFSCWRRLIVTCCLQWVLIVIGFLLLILPGIYLSVGYTYAMVLVVDKGLSPWQAMEESRKVIHKIWWKMFGLYIAVGLVIFLGTIPLGIGLIWCVPWSLVLMGVLYHFLFTEDHVESV